MLHGILFIHPQYYQFFLIINYYWRNKLIRSLFIIMPEDISKYGDTGLFSFLPVTYTTPITSSLPIKWFNFQRKRCELRCQDHFILQSRYQKIQPEGYRGLLNQRERGFENFILLLVSNSIDELIYFWYILKARYCNNPNIDLFCAKWYLNIFYLISFHNRPPMLKNFFRFN